MALTCTTISGGKDPWASGSGKVLKPGESFLEKALAPQADDFSTCTESVGDLFIG
jgi:hypothetical protein